MELCTKFPIVDGAKYAIHEGGLKEMYLTNVWGPNLAITGIDGIPEVKSAGNVVRASTSARLSMRLCPITDPNKAVELMKKKLTEDVPWGAKVTIKNSHGGSGWCMKDLSDSFRKSIE